MFDLNRQVTPSGVRNHRPAARRPVPGTRARTLCLPADDQALARVRPSLEAALQHAGWDEAERFDVLVATTEALVNAVAHGSRPGAPVGVIYAVGPDAARVTVVDRGAGSAAAPAWPPQCPGVDAAHGRGLLLIAAAASEVELEPCDGGTRITMCFSRASDVAHLAA